MEPWNRRIVDEKYHYLYNTPSDINEHLPVFRRYAKECNTVVELGTRWIVGTWGFLMGLSDPARSNWENRPLNKKLISIDIDHPEIHGSNLEEVYIGAKQWDIHFEFRQENTLKNEIEECDFLFLDTWHSYDQVTNELILHADKAKKYIGFHDTESYDFEDMSNTQGLWPAIENFLSINKQWYVYEKFANNNGLTILKRK